ncbi:MAG TPA: HEAT repeat domain-containing protein, partial [Planctomycetaceae bacterium]|nr:HEAT repeat domain-containing protein [Planctomycetaceae bacterium]
EAIGKIGSDSTEVASSLARLLTETDEAVLQAALAALGELGAAARESVPHVSRLLNHGEPSVRSVAVQMLPRVQSDTGQVVPLLVEALKDDDWTVRTASAGALGRVGGPARPAVPLLFEMLAVETDRDAARAALREIDDVEPAALPTLIAALDSEDRSARFYALFFLGKLGPGAREALPALKRLRDEGDSERSRRFLDEAIQKIEGQAAGP